MKPMVAFEKGCHFIPYRSERGQVGSNPLYKKPNQGPEGASFTVKQLVHEYSNFLLRVVVNRVVTCIYFQKFNITYFSGYL